MQELTSNLEELFPLPLAPLEKYLVLDDRPASPMTSFIELHFSGPLQTSALAEALRQTVHTHVLLASTLVEIDGHLHWRYNPDFVPELRCPSSNPILSKTDAIDNDQPNPRPIDLFREPGCRYWYHVDSQTNHSALILQLHHAACDGVGLRRVLIDALTAYAKITCGESNAQPTERELKKRKREAIQPDRLLDRAGFSELLSKPAKQTQSVWRKIANAHSFYFQRPQPLLGGQENASTQPCPEQTSPGQTSPNQTSPNQTSPNQTSTDQPLVHHVFDTETSSRLQETCRRLEIGVNDLMLAVLFRTCQRWNEAHGLNHDTTRIRLLMPVDLRGRSDLQMPATNRLSFAFLGRTHRQCNDWNVLLSGVQKETQMIKDTRVYMDFLDGLKGLASHPKWFKRVLNVSRNMSTSVMTYTGDISRGMKNYFPEEDGRRKVGDAFLENIFVAPPAHENTNITLGVCINWGQVCVSANWNRDVINATECEQFLTLFAETTNECLDAVGE